MCTKKHTVIHTYKEKDVQSSLILLAAHISILLGLQGSCFKISQLETL